MTNQQRRSRIADEQARIEEAEQALASAITTLKVAARADKVTVNQAVREALDRLSEARAILIALEAASAGN
jgi:hypothetical protein